MKTAKILVMTEFSSWLMGRFTEWERGQSRRQSYSAFARYLGVNQASLSQWMIGNYVPVGENVKKLAAKLGPGVYDALGLPRPDEIEEALIRLYRLIPPEQKEEYSQALREFVHAWATHHGYELEPDDNSSPDGRQDKPL